MIALPEAARPVWLGAAATAALVAACGGLAGAGPAPAGHAAALVLAAAVGLLLVWRIDAGIVAFLVARPVLDAFGEGGGSDVAAGLALLALAACGGWLVGQSGDRRTLWFARPVVPLVAAAAVSTVFSADLATSAVVGAAICASLLVALTTEVLVSRGMAPGAVVTAVLLGGVAPVAVGLFQLGEGGGWVGPDGVARLQGTFAHPNPFGASLALGLILLAALALTGGPGTQVAAGAAAVPVLILLGLTGSRSAWLAGGAGVVVMAARRSARAAAGAMAVLVLLLGTPVAQSRLGDLARGRQLDGRAANSAVWRIDYWRNAAGLVTSSPYTGIGLGGVAREEAAGKDPHNDVVRVVAELGVLGLLAYGALAVHLLRRFAAEWARPPTLGGTSALGAIAAAAALSLTTNLLGNVAVMTPLLAVCFMAGRPLDAATG